MNAAVVAAIASSVAVALSLAALIVNRRDRASDWRRDIITPSVRGFILPTDNADMIITTHQMAVGMGADPTERRERAYTEAWPSIQQARTFATEFELFAPELAKIADRISEKLILSLSDFDQMQLPVQQLEGGTMRAQRPVFAWNRELARRARIMSRVERRTAREFLSHLGARWKRWIGRRDIEGPV
jgi:hypothetical protein